MAKIIDLQGNTVEMIDAALVMIHERTVSMNRQEWARYSFLQKLGFATAKEVAMKGCIEVELTPKGKARLIGLQHRQTLIQQGDL